MIRLERRLHTPRWVSVAVPVGSLAATLLIVGVILVVSGHDPISTYGDMVSAAVTGDGALAATLVSATPLLFTGLCAAVAFRMRLWNIGGEGQLYLGALGAAFVGLHLGGAPNALAIIAMIAGGAVAGALWMVIPALLRAYRQTNEILTSLMLNYVGGLLLYYLIFDSSSYWRDVSSPSARVFPQGKLLGAGTWWPTLHLGVAVPLGFVVGTVLAVGLLVVLRSTRLGFRVRVMANSPAVGHYAGMRTRRTILGVLLLSAALAGIGGASQVGDFSHMVDAKGLQQVSFGYTGIVVAALARLNPLATVASAVLIGGLQNAGFQLQGASFPSGLVGTMTGVILLCVIGGELFGRYRLRTAWTLRGGPEDTNAVSAPTRTVDERIAS